MYVRMCVCPTMSHKNIARPFSTYTTKIQPFFATGSILYDQIARSTAQSGCHISSSSMIMAIWVCRKKESCSLEKKRVLEA